MLQPVRNNRRGVKPARARRATSVRLSKVQNYGLRPMQVALAQIRVSRHERLVGHRFSSTSSSGFRAHSMFSRTQNSKIRSGSEVIVGPLAQQPMFGGSP